VLAELYYGFLISEKYYLGRCINCSISLIDFFIAMETKQRYRVIGLMSGTSLDGVDVACCVFAKKGDQWKFQIEKAMTVSYTDVWNNRLSSAGHLSGEELIKLHVDYGAYLGNLTQKFLKLYAIKKVDFIASHGHTVFHQPEKKITFQACDANALHAASKLPVVADFRSLDVALGGQGAPLVPLGDQFLFSDYDVCLNLGGIANLSYQAKGKRTAFDVCFVNMGLNHLAQKAGKAFDENGLLSSDGQLHTGMLNALNKVYASIRSKRPSLSREFFEQHIQPILDQSTIDLKDRLHTLTESIAIEMATSLQAIKKKVTVLCTGGGTHNAYLIYRILEYGRDQVDLIIPETEIVKFKEALIFAFLGVKRVRNEINCLKSVTKASRDSSSGVLVGF
jgi:anhydro-N-acetylmuramic acid kinase